MIIDCAITNHTCPQLLNIQRGSSNMWNIQLSLHSTQLLPFHKPLPSGIMAAILNHHCQFLTQLNCHPFTTPLSWQQYSTTYCQFFTQLNCHSFTNHSPLVSWQQYSTTIADFSLNSTVIHSPLPYHGSNTQPPIANFSLNSAANPLPSGNMAAIVLSHHCWFLITCILHSVPPDKALILLSIPLPTLAYCHTSNKHCPYVAGGNDKYSAATWTILPHAIHLQPDILAW